MRFRLSSSTQHQLTTKCHTEKTSQDIIIQENVKLVAIQTKTTATNNKETASLKNYLEESKRFAGNEILSLKAQAYNGSSDGKEATHLKL